MFWLFVFLSLLVFVTVADVVRDMFTLRCSHCGKKVRVLYSDDLCEKCFYGRYGNNEKR